MGTQICNGHTGTEHMTAARWQAVFKSWWGADNVVFKTGSELAITVTPGTGTVTIADGVFSFNGVLGTVETSDTATYVKPASDTLFAKIGVAVKYTKDSETQVEAFDIVCLKSAETASVELAQVETIDYGDGEIETAITEAYYPLYEFIANASGYSNLESLVNKVDTIPAIAADLAAEITAEANARSAADTILDTAITNLETAVKWNSVVQIPGASVYDDYAFDCSTYAYYKILFYIPASSTTHSVIIAKANVTEGVFSFPVVVGSYFSAALGNAIIFCKASFERVSDDTIVIKFLDKTIVKDADMYDAEGQGPGLLLGAVYGSNTLIP